MVFSWLKNVFGSTVREFAQYISMSSVRLVVCANENTTRRGLMLSILRIGTNIDKVVERQRSDVVYS